LFGDTWTSDFPFQDGSGKASFSYTVKGSLKTGRGGGTLSVHRAETDTTGTTTSTCDAQNVHWSVAQ
jgi:hypothetical protein